MSNLLDDTFKDFEGVFSGRKSVKVSKETLEIIGLKGDSAFDDFKKEIIKEGSCGEKSGSN